MKRSLSRTSFGLVVLIACFGAGDLLSQQAVTPSSQPNAPATAATSSTEQGQTPLTETFDFREFQLAARKKALEDTKFEFQLRTYYFDREDFNGSRKQAWAIGGWAGVKTGYFLEHFAFGLTAYASAPLYAPEENDGTLLLKPGQEGYAVLGEAYAEIRIVDDMILSIGRKAYDTPFINKNDTRMTPNTFEAIVLQGRIVVENLPPAPQVTSEDSKDPAPAPAPTVKPAAIKYGVGYVEEIKERNADRFVSMSADAGAPVDHGVLTAGAIYEKGKFSLGAIDYYCEDVINIAYGEIKGEMPIGSSVRLRLAGQFVDQRSVGDEVLQAGGFSVRQFGVKVELPVSNFLFTTAFTAASDGNANLRAPWSGYPGYTSVQVQDFNRTGESAIMFRIGYDVACIPGLSAYVLAVFGGDPQDPSQFRQDEYDANLQWTPPKGCLKGFSVRARYAVVHQHGGSVNDLTDLRGIVNYNIKF
jgi:outer membrane OprD family porin